MKAIAATCAISLGVLAGCSDRLVDCHFGTCGDYPQPEDALAADDAFLGLVGTDGYTDPATYPTSAHYDGEAVILSVDAEYYGLLDMDADFIDSTFSGTMDEFNKYDSTRTYAYDTDGSFIMSGTISDSNGGFDALEGSATGTLDGTADDLAVYGNIAGTDADAVELLLIGNDFLGAAYGYRP